MALKTVHKIGIGGGAAVIAATIAFLPAWEGMDLVARRDSIGTGHPTTFCFGQTDEFGKVKVGTRFTKEECDEKLAESLPKYLVPLQKCVGRELPDKTMAALLDAAYNAGPAAVCRSPMVAKMNVGDLRGGCNAFAGWYVRSDGQVRKGLVARRQGDGRKGEKQLCLEGLQEGITRTEDDSCSGSGQGADCPRDRPKAVTRHKPKPASVPKVECKWWMRCAW